jgi:hypothetical protein
MFKLVLIFAIGVMSHNQVEAKVNVEPETKDLKEWVYWNAFSKTFNETADFWKAESAALEAEKLAEERTNVEQFLKDIQKKEESDKICKI